MSSNLIYFNEKKQRPEEFIKVESTLSSKSIKELASTIKALTESKESEYNYIENKSKIELEIAEILTEDTDIDIPLNQTNQKGQERIITRPSTEGETIMDWQEQYINKLNDEIKEVKDSINRMHADLSSSQRHSEERISAIINQNSTEIRNLDNQRHLEIMTLKQDIGNLRTDNAATRKWIIGMVIAAIGVSVSAIIGVASIVIRLISKS